MMPVVSHHPDCAVRRSGELMAWCDCGAEAPVLEEIRRKVWHKIGADHERAQIVAWLRGNDTYDFDDLAIDIEAGEHRDD